MKLAPINLVMVSAEPVDPDEIFWQGVVKVGDQVAFRTRRNFPDAHDAQEHLNTIYRRGLARLLTMEEESLPCEHVHSIYLDQ